MYKRQAWHSVFVAAVCVVGNVVLASLAGYALTCMKFRGKKVVMASCCRFSCCRVK